MIYINFVELFSLMLHAKFQNQRPSASVIYSHGDHVSHVTLTIFTIFHCPFLMMLHINLALIGEAVSEKKLFEYYGHIHVYSLEAVVDNPLGINFYININLPSICLSPNFPQFNYILLIFHIQKNWQSKLTLP